MTKGTRYQVKRPHWGDELLTVHYAETVDEAAIAFAFDLQRAGYDMHNEEVIVSYLVGDGMTGKVTFRQHVTLRMEMTFKTKAVSR